MVPDHVLPGPGLGRPPSFPDRARLSVALRTPSRALMRDCHDGGRFLSARFGCDTPKFLLYEAPLHSLPPPRRTRSKPQQVRQPPSVLVIGFVPLAHFYFLRIGQQ